MEQCARCWLELYCKPWSWGGSSCARACESRGPARRPWGTVGLPLGRCKRAVAPTAYTADGCHARYGGRLAHSTPVSSRFTRSPVRVDDGCLLCTVVHLAGPVHMGPVQFKPGSDRVSTQGHSFVIACYALLGGASLQAVSVRASGLLGSMLVEGPGGSSGVWARGAPGEACGDGPMHTYSCLGTTVPGRGSLVSGEDGSVEICTVRMVLQFWSSSGIQLVPAGAQGWSLGWCASPGHQGHGFSGVPHPSRCTGRSHQLLQKVHSPIKLCFASVLDDCYM